MDRTPQWLGATGHAARADAFEELAFAHDAGPDKMVGNVRNKGPQLAMPL
jgi:hypothetical protein